MRQIVLDTETTGLDPKLGHRIIEIGCIEIVNRRLTQRNLHFRFNPDRDIDIGATGVHGMTWDDLKDKPRFGDRASQLVEFLRDAELVIHNASFDVGFLDAELALAGLSPLTTHCAGVLDTLKLARELHPGKRNSLDVLCERYQVDHSARTLHGALLDAELLADVYLAMTRGQESLAIAVDTTVTGARYARRMTAERTALRVIRASDAEIAAHVAYLEFLERESRRSSVWTGLIAAATAASVAAPAADPAAVAVAG